MDRLIILRFARCEFGTYGRIALAEHIIYTIERPWLGNQPGISCIPRGTYLCRPRRFYRGGYDAIEVTGVPGRSYILFHKANWPHEVKGCIAPNWALGPGNSSCPMRGVSSAPAFAQLMKEFGGREFELEVRSIEERNVVIGVDGLLGMIRSGS